MYCKDVTCVEGTHRSDIDTICKQLIDVLLRAGKETLPLRKGDSKAHDIPFWNEKVANAKEVAMFWHWLRVDNGRPTVYAVMRRTRAKYHFAVRRVRACMK